MSLPNCPKCQSEYTYQDGDLLICPECSHEWKEGEQLEETAAVVDGLLADGDVAVRGEEELEQVLLRESENLKGVVADPLYRPVCPENVAFYELPHIAFSGRIYKKKLPVLAELI